MLESENSLQILSIYLLIESFVAVLRKKDVSSDQQ